MLRAFGALERDETVRNPDHLAGSLAAASRTYRFGLRVASVPALHACCRWAFSRVTPGAYWAETARVKYVDEVLLGELAGGVRQVVVLGAGMDSRAYRFAPELGGVRTIEVDHPVTSARKRARVEAVFGALPPDVTYLALDLTTDDLGQSLTAAGLDPSTPVLVLWIGVSMYLNEGVVAGVLGWAGGLSERSSIAFDYMERRFFEDERRFGAPRRTRFLMARSGEELSYGIARPSLPGLLARYGLSVKSHLGPTEMEARYLRRSNGRLAGHPFAYSGFVHAGVDRP